MDDLVSDFIAETREGLEALDSELVRFEQHPDDPETLGGIFRLIHTIKGTCGFLGLTRLQSVAHAAENVLGGFRDGALAVTPEAVSAILETVDLIRALTDALTATGAEPAGDDSALVSRLEAVLSGAGEDSQATVVPAAATDRRPLIERLGGDATLDAAAEAAVARMNAEASDSFGAADPDRVQAALRDSLAAMARKPGPPDAFQRALREAAPGGTAPVASACAQVRAALRELEVSDPPLDELEALAWAVPDAAQAEPVAEVSADAAPEPPIATAPEARKPAHAPAPAGLSGEGPGPAQTIRVSVDALEHLMTVVSELVLIRNQLIQTLRLEPESPFAAPLNRLNQVTSELQEGVMTTRMQPISGAWAKLPRLVRDLAQELGKSIDVSMSGQ